MSVPPTGEESPKTGKDSPSAGTRKLCQGSCVSSQSRIGSRHVDQGHHGLDGRGRRTVKGWLGGSNGPSGEHLECLLRSSNGFTSR